MKRFCQKSLKWLAVTLGILVLGQAAMPGGISAQAAAVVRYRITFDMQGGTPQIQPMDSESGLLIAKPDDPTRVGYTFVGWSLNPSTPSNPLGAPQWDFTKDTVKKENMKLYAIWTQNPGQEVTFNLTNNYGSVTPSSVTQTVYRDSDPKTVTPGSVSVPFTGSNGGAKFSGWYREAAFSTLFSSESYSATSPKTVNLWARFQRTLYFRTLNDAGTETTHVIWNFYVDQTSGFYQSPTNPVTRYVTEPIEGGAGNRVGVPYTFSGWYKEKEYTTSFTPDGSIAGLNFDQNGNTFVYAKYERDANAVKCSVELRYDNGKATSPVIQFDVPYGSRLVLESPTRDGADFNGWFYEDTGKKWATTDIVAKNMVLEAKYVCKIEYVSNGGCFGKQQEYINYGGILQDPGSPSFPGHEFCGWVSAETQKFVRFPLTVETHAMLIAAYDCNRQDDNDSCALIGIKYNTNGGVPAFNATQKVQSGFPFPCAVTAVSKTDFVLEGWYLEDKKWDFETDTSLVSITLTAKWIPLYYADYYIDNARLFSYNVPQDEYMPKPDPAKMNVKPEKKFIGWTYKQNGASVLLQPQPEYKLQLTQTVFEASAPGNSNRFRLDATFETLPTVTLVYDNGSNYIVTAPVYEGEDGKYYFHFPPNDPRRFGYTFGGWIDQEGNVYNNSTPIPGTITLRAKWNEATIRIYFYPNNPDASYLPEVYVTTTAGNKILPVSYPTINGQVIVSWHRDPSCLGAPIDFNQWVVEENTNLYGKWGTAGKVTVTFADVYGRQIRQDVIDYGSLLDRSKTPPVSDLQYIFQNEWLFDGFLYDFNVPFTQDITLVAYVKHSVTFNSNSGTAVPAIESFHGEAIYEPAAPTRAGYLFDGWYTDAQLTQKWDFIGGESPGKVTRNITLYAKWSQNTAPVITVPSELRVVTDDTGELTATVRDDGLPGSGLSYTPQMKDNSPLPESVTHGWADGATTENGQIIITFAPEESEEGNVYEMVLTAGDGHITAPQKEFKLIAVKRDRAPISIASAKVVDRYYDGTTYSEVTDVEFTGLKEGDVLKKGIDYIAFAELKSPEAGKNIPATVTVTMMRTRTTLNYAKELAPYNTTGNILKAPGLEADIVAPNILNGAGGIYLVSFPLDDIQLNRNDAGPKEYIYVSVSGDGMFREYPMIAQGVLNYVVILSPGQACSASIKLRLVTQNYEDIFVEVPLQYRPDILSPESLVITGQPEDVTVLPNGSALLQVNVSNLKGTVSYQWYENRQKSNEGGTAIQGATDSSYYASSKRSGTKYYYCIVTASAGVDRISVRSQCVSVTVMGKVTVTFDANGGSVTPSSMQTDYNGRLPSLPTPIRNPYTFDGWFLSDGTQVTQSDVFMADTTICAVWTSNFGDDVIVPSYDCSASVNLTKETVTLPSSFHVAAYSINGGNSWKKGALPAGVKFSALLNTQLNLAVTNELGKNNKPLDTSKIIAFPPIEKRPAANAEKLAPYYESSVWSLKTKPTSQQPAGDPQKIYEYARADSKGQPTGEWTAVSSKFPVESVVKGKPKTVYLFRTRAKAKDGIYTPVGKQFKITPANFAAAPKYKIDVKNMRLTLKKGYYYSIDDGTQKDDYINKAGYLPIDDRLKLKKLTVWKAETGTQPRSEKQVIAPVFLLSSSSVEQGFLANECGHLQGNQLPDLNWSLYSTAIQPTAYAILMYDTSTPGNGFLHWAVTDIPKDFDPKDLSRLGVQHYNDFGSSGYYGPEPPKGAHSYHIVVYALKQPIGKDAQNVWSRNTGNSTRYTVTKANFEKYLGSGNIIAQQKITMKYKNAPKQIWVW